MSCATPNWRAFLQLPVNRRLVHRLPLISGICMPIQVFLLAISVSEPNTQNIL